jgi:hypothetical protein
MKRNLKFFARGTLVAALFLSAAGLAAQTLHSVVVVDSNDRSIGASVQKDMDTMVAFSREIASNTGMRLNLKTLNGSQLNEANLRRLVNGITPGPQDAVLFYYSGHGFRTRATPTKWPMLYIPGSRGVDFAELLKIIERKNPRMILAITDSCNSYTDSASRAFGMNLRALEEPSQTAWRKLFLQFRGRIYASSSKAGEYSMAESEGGSYTLQFLRVFRRAIAAPNPEWDRIMKDSARPIRTGSSQQPTQNPQYELVAQGSAPDTNIQVPDDDMPQPPGDVDGPEPPAPGEVVDITPDEPNEPGDVSGGINCDDLTAFLTRLRQLQSNIAQANLQNAQQRERYRPVVQALQQVGGPDDQFNNLVERVAVAYKLNNTARFRSSFGELVNYVTTMQRRECR